MVLDDDGTMGKLPEDLHDPPETNGVDAFVEVTFEIKSRMKMSWLIASPVFAVDAGYSILQKTEAFSIGFSEWGKEFVTDSTCVFKVESRRILLLFLCLLNGEMSSEEEGTEDKTQEKHKSINPSG
jgi:hypothetical protein